MIAGTFIYILTLFIGVIMALLPSWSIYPADLLTGLEYFATSLAKLNFIFPIDSLFTVLLFIIDFEILYFTAKIIMKVFNYFYGGLDI